MGIRIDRRAYAGFGAVPAPELGGTLLQLLPGNQVGFSPFAQAVQSLLQRDGYTNLTADGRWGDCSEKALRDSFGVKGQVSGAQVALMSGLTALTNDPGLSVKTWDKSSPYCSNSSDARAGTPALDNKVPALIVAKALGIKPPNSVCNSWFPGSVPNMTSLACECPFQSHEENGACVQDPAKPPPAAPPPAPVTCPFGTYKTSKGTCAQISPTIMAKVVKCGASNSITNYLGMGVCICKNTYRSTGPNGTCVKEGTAAPATTTTVKTVAPAPAPAPAAKTCPAGQFWNSWAEMCMPQQTGQPSAMTPIVYPTAAPAPKAAETVCPPGLAVINPSTGQCGCPTGQVLKYTTYPGGAAVPQCVVPEAEGRPWWMWALGAGVLVAVGYGGWRLYKRR